MERITISLKTDLAHQFDTFIEEKGYSNRSEAVRDLIRDRLEAERLQQNEDGCCVGVASYVYNIHELDLPLRMARIQHQHHHLSPVVTHMALDRDTGLETVHLRGSAREVRSLAEAMIAERGVRHGHLHIIPVASGANQLPVAPGSSAPPIQLHSHR